VLTVRLSGRGQGGIGRLKVGLLFAGIAVDDDALRARRSAGRPGGARCGVACARRARGAGCREGCQPCRDERPLRLPRAHNLHEPPYARTVDRA
jgi:hypothetical protein